MKHINKTLTLIAMAIAIASMTTGCATHRHNPCPQTYGYDHYHRPPNRF